jgi:hypothetical protein
MALVAMAQCSWLKRQLSRQLPSKDQQSSNIHSLHAENLNYQLGIIVAVAYSMKSFRCGVYGSAASNHKIQANCVTWKNWYFILHNLLFGLHNQNLDHFESHLKSYSNKTQTATMMQVLSMKGMDVYYYWSFWQERVGSTIKFLSYKPTSAILCCLNMFK